MNFEYDKKQLLDLMKDFYSLTKIKTVVYDIDFKVIASVPENECEFCTALREKSQALKKCDECVIEASELCRKENKLNIYKCHAGLVEAIAPIKINDIIVGYMMLGQLLEKSDKDIKKEKIISYAESFGNIDFWGKYQKLTVKSYSEISSAAKLMESCVCYLLMHKVIKESTGNTAFNISDYISKNLSSDLTVEKLCSEFNVSRNKLYKISDTFFGMPIAEFIRKKRIEYAAELIKSSVTVTLASELTGFCDYSYFSKVFKAHMGISPVKFSKQSL